MLKTQKKCTRGSTLQTGLCATITKKSFCQNYQLLLTDREQTVYPGCGDQIFEQDLMRWRRAYSEFVPGLSPAYGADTGCRRSLTDLSKKKRIMHGRLS